jgi:hypothetical protein
LAFAEAAIQDVELTLGLHGEAIDRVFEFFRCIGVEMPEAATQVRGRAHLPEQPVQCFGAACQVGGQEGAEFFRQVEQDRTGFEDPEGRLHAAVQQGRQGFFVSRPSDRAVDAGELAARRGVVFPDLGRNVGRLAHRDIPHRLLVV